MFMLFFLFYSTIKKTLYVKFQSDPFDFNSSFNY